MKICKKHARTREEEIKARFTYLIANAILYHTPPQVVAEQIYDQPPETFPITVVKNNGTFARFHLNNGRVDREQFFFFTNADEQVVTVIGKTNGALIDTRGEQDVWIYVCYQPSSQQNIYQYGWFRKDTLNLTKDALESIPSLTFAQTLPLR